MRYIALNLVEENFEIAIPFPPCANTREYLMIIQDKKVGFLEKSGVIEWADESSKWIEQEVPRFLERKVWVEISPEEARQMGFKIVPE
jgi:hypothetical protein